MSDFEVIKRKKGYALFMYDEEIGVYQTMEEVEKKIAEINKLIALSFYKRKKGRSSRGA